MSSPSQPANSDEDPTLTLKDLLDLAAGFQSLIESYPEQDQETVRQAFCDAMFVQGSDRRLEDEDDERFLKSVRGLIAGRPKRTWKAKTKAESYQYDGFAETDRD